MRLINEFNLLTPEQVCKGIDFDLYASSSLMVGSMQGDTDGNLGYSLFEIERFYRKVKKYSSGPYRIVTKNDVAEVKPLALADFLLPPPFISKKIDEIHGAVYFIPIVDAYISTLSRHRLSPDDFGSVGSVVNGVEVATKINDFVKDLRLEFEDPVLIRRIKTAENRSLNSYKMSANFLMSSLRRSKEVFIVRADLWCVASGFKPDSMQISSMLDTALKSDQAKGLGSIVGYCGLPIFSPEFGYGLHVFIILAEIKPLRPEVLDRQIADLWRLVTGGKGASFAGPDHPNPLMGIGTGYLDSRDEFKRLEALSGLAYLAKRQCYFSAGNELFVRRLGG